MAVPATEVTPAAGGAEALTPQSTIFQVLHALNVGGAEVLAVRLARQLQDRYRFVFACLDELGTLGKELRAEGFPVHVLERRAGLDWRCVLRLAKLMRQEGANVVHAHQYTPFFYAAIARMLYRRVPVLFTEHGRHQPDYRRWKRVLANRCFLLRRHDRVVGVGEAVRRALIENEGLPPQRVELIYNGIDLAAFRNTGQERLCIRQEIGVAADDLVMMQVARLDYLKDHATALRMLSRLAPQCPHARLVIVGEGPEQGKIDALIQELHLQPFVRLLGLRNDVPRLLAAADLLLLSSTSEGIPLTVIEGMAASLPVVATKVGGLPEVVEDGGTGWLAPSGDAAGLAERVLRLSADPGLRMQMGRRGRERAETLFSEQQMHARYDRVFQEILGSL
jgi:glycosyltransferase involved in cell wall biosynthesis